MEVVKLVFQTLKGLMYVGGLPTHWHNARSEIQSGLNVLLMIQNGKNYNIPRTYLCSYRKAYLIKRLW